VSIGERVRAGRKALHLSQEEVARRAGVSLNQVNRLERGEIVDPHFSTLSGLATALDMQISELVGEPSVPLGEDPRGAGDPDLEWLPGYLRFLKQHTESMRTRWEAAIKENTVEPGAWYEAAEVAMELAKRCVETIPLPLYATEDRGQPREEGEATVADALGSLSMLNNTLDRAYHVCERRFGEKGDLDDVEYPDRDNVVDLPPRLPEQHRRLLEVPKPLKAAGAG
jgi:transcriptional regulator with XRE-family HTH domain